MSDDPQIPNPPNGPTAVDPMSRRAFGQTIGAAAVGSTLQTALFGAAPADPDVRASQLAQQATDRTDELVYLSAIELAARIRSKQVSAREVMAAHLAQIERVNPKVNAIVTLVSERAMADAARAD
jgi:amidase